MTMEFLWGIVAGIAIGGSVGIVLLLGRVIFKGQD
jgi:hypothetical protein